MNQIQNSQRRHDLICQLKCLVEELVKDDSQKPSAPAFQRCCISTGSQQQQPPDIMVCYKTRPEPPPSKQVKKDGENAALNEKPKVVTCKSRELLAGVLYVGCDCGKKNGLQDDCRRTQCRGSPACLAKPEPTCCPSQYSNAKHLVSKMYKNEGKSKSQKENAAPAVSNAKESGDEYLCFPAVVDCCTCSL